MAMVDYFENEERALLGEMDFGGGAAGMALDVGETFLNDAEESNFERLRQALELGIGNELGLNPAAFAEAVGVLLEGGDETKIVEERRMEQVGERADFARHLLGEIASAVEGAGGGVVV